MEMTILVIVAILAAIVVYRRRDKRNDHLKTAAEYKMGTIYTFGRGIPAMDRLAAERFSVTARSGDVEACAALGYMYSRAIHFKRDYEEAFKWYSLAAEAKHPTATYELGVLFLEGHGAPRNESKAGSLIKTAAILGYSQAQSTLGMLYEAGECGLDENQPESLE